MHRLPLLLVTAVLETTIVSLPLLELGVLDLPWALLLAVLLLGTCVAWQVERLPARRQGLALAVAAGIAGVCAVAIRLGGLGVALGALLPTTNSQSFGVAYGTLLVALIVFWRGGGLHTHTAATVARTFSVGVFVSIIALLLAPLLSSRDMSARTSVITLQLVLMVGSGLLAQALVRADEDNEGGLQRLSWRWVITLGGAIGVVALLGLAASGLFGGPAAAALEQLWRLVIFALVLVMLPFIWLAASLINWLITLLSPAMQQGRPIITIPRLPELPAGAHPLFSAMPDWAMTSLAGLLSLLPLLVVLLLIIFIRRRRKRQGEDEERESLLSWSELGADLRGLLRGLRNPFARPLAGLRAALAALGGGDADSRARRAYVRLLLALEARERPRPAASTPAEYAPQAQGALPESAPAVITLTVTYERARYAPGSLTPEAATAAEQAWNELEAQQNAKRKT